MKVLITILVIIGILFIIKSCIKKDDNKFNDNSRPNTPVDKTPIENDRIIIIKDANYEDIKKVVLQFCNIYNKEKYSVTVQLTQISKNEIVLTFPYDIDFATYCFFINYLYYPNEIFYKANIKGWTTTKSTDEFISKENANKFVMLYIPADDKEYDNVYMTTEDNKGYKLGFSAGGLKTLNLPKDNFERNNFGMADIVNKPSEKIQ